MLHLVGSIGLAICQAPQSVVGTPRPELAGGEVLDVDEASLAADGSAVALRIRSRNTHDSKTWHIAWLKRREGAAPDALDWSSAEILIPGSPAIGRAVVNVGETDVAMSGDGTLMVFEGTLRDPATASMQSGLIVARVVAPTERGETWRYTAQVVSASPNGPLISGVTKPTIAPQSNRVFFGDGDGIEIDANGKRSVSQLLALDIGGVAAVGAPESLTLDAIDRNSGGEPANSWCGGSELDDSVQTDPTGRFAAFPSGATNLDVVTPARGPALYLADLEPNGVGHRQSGVVRTRLVSVDRTGAFLEDTFEHARLSADARWLLVECTAELTAARVIGAPPSVDHSRHASAKYVLYDLDADCDGVIGNSAPKPYLWGSVVADECSHACIRATQRGWLMTRFHADRSRELGIFSLQDHAKTAPPHWVLASTSIKWPPESSSDPFASSFDGRWIVYGRKWDERARHPLAEWVSWTRIP